MLITESMLEKEIENYIRECIREAIRTQLPDLKNEVHKAIASMELTKEHILVHSTPHSIEIKSV